MKDIEFVETPPKIKKGANAFICSHCGNNSDYLEFRGIDLDYRDLIYPDKDYIVKIKCPSCMQGVREITFSVKAD